MNLPDHHPYYYKFMGWNGEARYGTGSIGPVGEWMPTVKRLEPCESGYHVITPEGLLDWIAPELYRVEVKGNWIWKEEGKVLVVESYRQHSRVEHWNDRTQRLLAAEFAQWAVDRYWTDKSDTRPQQAIDTARLYADGKISDAELSAAYNAARSAARGAAYSAADSAAYSVASAAYSVDSAAYSVASAAYSAASAAYYTASSAGYAELNQLMVDFLSEQSQ
jgi:hypothetical protein